MKNVLEGKADEDTKIPAPTLMELQKLEMEKADRKELEHLKAEIERLDNIVQDLDEEIIEGEYSSDLE